MMGTPRIRSNLLYGDGCPDLQIGSCLECPLSRCRYDESESGGLTLVEERDAAIMRAWDRGGQTPASLAERFGVSARTINRVLTTARQQEGMGR